MAKMIRLSCFIYGRLLFFYPREFRDRFGEEMVELFGDLLREAMLRRDAAGAVSLWLSAWWELLTVAVPARLLDSSVVAGILSLIVSSALFLAFFRAVS